jgi:hypothetical protein
MSTIAELDMKRFMNVVSDEDLRDTKHIRGLCIPKHITKLPIGAFSSRNALKKIRIETGSQLKKIPEYAFAYCTSLREVNQLPDDLVSIEAYAFLNCVAVDEITIPTGVIYIDENAFDGWTENQTIYVNGDYQFGSGCKANIVNLKQTDIADDVSEDIYSEEGLNFYIVRAKCGHVGRPNYIPIDFPIRAKDAKQAAKITRKIGRVKHNHKDAILSVARASKNEYVNQYDINKKDPYLNVKSKHEQMKVIDQIKERLIADPHYVPKRNKRYVLPNKSELSSAYKIQRAYKRLVYNHEFM